MRAVQVSRPNGPLEMVKRPSPEPSPGSARIKVQARGICSMKEAFPLERAAEAYDRMMSDPAGFRVVLTTGH